MQTCIGYPVLANHQNRQLATNLEFLNHLTNNCIAEIAVQEIETQTAAVSDSLDLSSEKFTGREQDVYKSLR